MAVLDDDLLGLDEAVPEEVRKLVEPKVPAPLALLAEPVESLAVAQEKALRRVREGVHAKAAGVIDAALAFAEIDPTSSDPPEAWVKELGEDLARKKFEVAKSAWASLKNAPVGIKVATDVYLGLEAAAARNQQPSVQLNVGKIEMNFAMPKFDEEEVKDGHDE